MLASSLRSIAMGSAALLRPALRHTMPTATSTRGLSYYTMKRKIDLAPKPANKWTADMIAQRLPVQFRPVKDVREFVVLPLHLDSAAKAKALTQPIEMSPRAKELVRLLCMIDTQQVKDDHASLTGSPQGDKVLTWMRRIQHPTPPRIGRPERPASEHDAVAQLTQVLLTYITGTLADQPLLVSPGTELPLPQGQGKHRKKHAVPDVLIQSITPGGLVLLNHTVVVTEGKKKSSPPTDGVTKSMAQMIMNGVGAGFQNQDEVEQELLRSASQSMKTHSVLSSLSPDDLGLLVRKFMTTVTKKYSTVVYLVLVRGFEYRFFSMRLDGALLDQFEAQITPAKPVAIHELTLFNADGTEFKGDVTKPTDRAIVLETLDTMMQQSQQQQDETLQFLKQWDDWIAVFVRRHSTLKSIQEAIKPKSQ